MVGLCSSYFYERNGSYARIVAFVVDTRFRGKGIGKVLNQEAERCAKEKGYSAIALNSGNRPERQDAHQFYRRLGYLDKSIVFQKRFNDFNKTWILLNEWAGKITFSHFLPCTKLTQELQFM